MAKRAGTWEEQEQKRLRVQDADEESDGPSLAQELESMAVEEEVFKCSFCDLAPITSAQKQSWNHWVTMAQDRTGVEQIQEYLGVFLSYRKTGNSSTRLGWHVLSCKECLKSYKAYFQSIADCTDQARLPPHLSSLRAADGAVFQAYRIVAKQLALQLAPKLFALG